MDVLSFSVCKCHFSSAHQGDKWGVGYSKSSFLDKVLAGLFQQEGNLPFLLPTQKQGEGDTSLVRRETRNKATWAWIMPELFAFAAKIW